MSASPLFKPATQLLCVCVFVSGCTSQSFGLSDSSSATTLTTPTMLVLDASSSMLSNDADGLRIDAAKTAARGLIERTPDGTPLGVVAYGHNIGDSDAEKAKSCNDVEVIRPLAPLSDPLAAVGPINQLQANGWTPLAKAIQTAVSSLPTEAETRVVVLSDGQDTCDGDILSLALDVARSHPQLRVDAVTFKDDASHLKELTNATGGVSVSADNKEQLESRLLAFGDADLRQSLNGNGAAGIYLGEMLFDIQSRIPDFPTEQCEQELCYYSYRGNKYSFARLELQGISLVEGETIDGLALGDDIGVAEKILGVPLETPNTDDLGRYIFASGTANAWAIETDGNKITSITLCKRQAVTDKVPSAATDSQAHSTGGTFQLVKEYKGIKVGANMMQLPGKLGVTDGLMRVGKYYAAGHSSGAWLFGEATNGNSNDIRVKYILPNVTDSQYGAIAFTNQAKADAYFGKPANSGTQYNMDFAFYPTNDPQLYFLVQWLPGNNWVEVTPVSTAKDFAEGQPLTASGDYAMGFGRIGSYDMSLKENQLSNPQKRGTCTEYRVQNHVAVFKKGKLLGYYAEPGFGTTARGVGHGSTLEDIRRAYADLEVEYSGSNVMSHRAVIQSPGNPDIYLGFALDANKAVSGWVTGGKEFANYYELCSS